MEIKAEVKSIEKLDRYFFNVPDYQREYVWKADDEVEQFIVDIDNEYIEETQYQKSYFIGSIILVESKGKFDVIDGQQRLTTIIIALCAFRDIISKHKKANKLSEKTEEYFNSVRKLLYKFDIETDKMQYRIDLQYEDSKEYLSSLISNEDFNETKTNSINKMEAAYNRLKSHFESYLENGIDALTSYLRYFLLRIELVVIETEELSSALKIFETINQRGAGLNAMDLVKNLIFKEAKEEEFSSIKKTWEKLVHELDSCNEINPLRFLRYVLIARYHNGVIREDEIYKWIISPEGKKSTGFEDKPKKFAKELYNASKRYSRLIRATELLGDGVEFKNVTSIGFINKYKSRQHLLLLMALNDSFSDEDIDYLAAQIESLLMFSITAGIQSKYNETRFANWAKILRKIKTREELEKFVDDNIYEFVCDNYYKFENEFLNKYDWNYRPLYRVRYILGKMDNYLRRISNLPENSSEFYDKKIQIEHILPQTPLNNWQPDEFTDDDNYRLTIHKLGNITLLEPHINQSINKMNDLQRDWFSDKCSQYRNSDILLTKALSLEYSIGETAIKKLLDQLEYRFKNWNKETIDLRQSILFEIALKTWQVNNKVAKPKKIQLKRTKPRKV
jgi:uncharacterized protein with ParB-like and HNH nuclease domain